MMSQSNIRELLVELPNKLKISKESATEALNNILKIFSSNDTSSKTKAYIALYGFSRISTSFQQTKHNFNLYFDCLVKFLPALNCDDYKKAIVYIFNFIAIGIGLKNTDTNLLLRKFIPSLPEIILEEVNDIQIIDHLVSIQMLYLELIYLNAKPKEIEYTLEQLKSLYDILLDKFQNKLIPTSLKLFKCESYVKLIYNNLEQSEDFLLHYMILLKLTKIETDSLNDNYMNLTKVLITFIKLDKTYSKGYKHSTMFVLTLSDLFKNYEFYQYSLICYYYILKNDSKKYILKENLCKFKKLLQFNQPNEIWFVDSVITFSQILLQSSPLILEANILKEDEFSSIFDIIENLFNFYKIIKIPKIKNLCQCDHENEHGIIILCGYSLDLLKKCIQLNIQNHKIIEIINNILNTIINYKCLNCKYIEQHIYNIVCKTFNALITLENFNDFNQNYGTLVNILIEIRSKDINNIKILKILKDINDKNFPKILDICALLAANIAENECSPKYLEPAILNFIKYGLEINKQQENPQQTVYLLTDIISNTNLPETLRPKSINEEQLMISQLEVCLKYNLLPQQEAENLTLKILNTQKDTLKIIQILGYLEKIQSKELLLALNQIKVEYSQKVLNNISKEQYSENLLILAMVFKIEALQKLSELKKTSKEKFSSISEEKLANMNLKDFDNFLIDAELNVIYLIEQCLKYYEQFYKISKEINLSINWILIFDNCSTLARHLHLRSYYSLSFKMWMLLYKFAKLKDCAENQIRAISYFCENYNTIMKIDKNFKLKDEIGNITEKILLKYKNLKDLTPRRQNYILICILNIALFHLHENNLKKCCILKQLVLNKLNNMDSRKYIFEFVKAKYYALEFELCCKIKFQSEECSLFNLIVNILNEIYNIQQITSEDTVNITTFLFEFVPRIAQYFISITASEIVIPALMVLFVNAFHNGTIRRMAEILSLWSIVNLQNEEHLNCQPKILILNKILEINKNIKSTEIANIKKNLFNSDATSKNFIKDVSLLSIEPTRRQAHSLSPLFYKMPIAAYNMDLTNYLIFHDKKCECKNCKYPSIKYLISNVGFIHARTFYYSDSNLVSQKFYEKWLEWYLKIKETDLFYSHTFELILTTIYCLNNLRGKQISKTFESVCNQMVDLLRNSNLDKLDFAFHWQIIEQIMAIEYLEKDKLKKVVMKPLKVKELEINDGIDRIQLTKNMEDTSTENSSEEISDALISVPNILPVKKVSNKNSENQLKKMVTKNKPLNMKKLAIKKISKACENITKENKNISIDSSDELSDNLSSPSNILSEKKPSNKHPDKLKKPITKKKPLKTEKLAIEVISKDIEKGTRKIKNNIKKKSEKENDDLINTNNSKSNTIEKLQKTNLYRLGEKFENVNTKPSSVEKKKLVTELESVDCSYTNKRVLRNRKVKI